MKEDGSLKLSSPCASPPRAHRRCLTSALSHGLVRVHACVSSVASESGVVAFSGNIDSCSDIRELTLNFFHATASAIAKVGIPASLKGKYAPGYIQEHCQRAVCLPRNMYVPLRRRANAAGPGRRKHSRREAGGAEPGG